MKISSFNPLIVSKDAENIIKLFEEIGFERTHKNAPVEGITDVTMKNEAGHKVDVTQAEVPQDLTIIRMNVDNFEEAYEFLMARGFVHKSGRIIETASSKSAMLTSPSGFGFDLCQHKK